MAQMGPAARLLCSFEVTINYGMDQSMPNFEFIVGTDLSSGAFWASAVCVKGQEDPYVVASCVTWLAELGHPRLVTQARALQ